MLKLGLNLDSGFDTILCLMIPLNYLLDLWLLFKIFSHIFWLMQLLVNGGFPYWIEILFIVRAVFFHTESKTCLKHIKKNEFDW